MARLPGPQLFAIKKDKVFVLQSIQRLESMNIQLFGIVLFLFAYLFVSLFVYPFVCLSVFCAFFSPPPRPQTTSGAIHSRAWAGFK